MEKNMKKNVCVYIYIYVYICVYTHIYIYIYIELNHSAIQQKLTLHCKLTILQLKKKKTKDNK